RCRFARQREVEEAGLLGEAPGDEADAHTRAVRAIELAPDPFRVAVARADQAEAARRRDGDSERTAGDETHGCEHQRLLDAQQRGDHVVRPARSLSFCDLIIARIFSQLASESLSSSVK